MIILVIPSKSATVGLAHRPNGGIYVVVRLVGTSNLAVTSQGP